ncbi:hypothetical protein BKI52_03830 [marine bacterium AO1-C]|nr:hypothetical protein BKI52_03830 [marine bacterium AO1-C]
MEDFDARIEGLFKQLYLPLVNYSNKFVKDSEAAREVVQATFVHILEKGALHITTSEEAYLYTAVRNRSLNYLKAKIKHSNRLEDTSEITVTASDDQLKELESSDLAHILDVAIASLSQKTQIIFHLSREESLTYKEISEQLDVSVKTVEFHISTALKTIRAFLEKHWYLPIVLIVINFI